MNKEEYLSSIRPYGSNCCDCGNHNQPYMITFELWRKVVGHSKKGIFLCLLCLENRLGRELTKEDFLQDIPINNGAFGFDYNKWVNLNKESQHAS